MILIFLSLLGFSTLRIRHVGFLFAFNMHRSGAKILALYYTGFHSLLKSLSLFQYKDANIQLLDLPGIIEGAAHGKTGVTSSVSIHLCVLLTGKGRGRQVIAVARTADLVLMMLDATKGEIQKYVWCCTLSSVGTLMTRTRHTCLWFISIPTPSY